MTAVRTATRAAALGAALVIGLAACGGSEEDAASTPSETSSSASSSETSSEEALSGDLVVFAAASLTDVFTALGDQMMAENPDLTVTFNFAGSSALATQITEGAPADVFAAASPATMQTVVDAGDATDPTTFTSNTLQIAVPAGNPAGVTGLQDFANADLTIALCAAEVPCGAAATRVFEATGITPAPDTLEQDVRAALTKVELDEVDAALVYRTDVIAAGDAVEGIDFPEAAEAVNDYPIAVVGEAPNSAAAQAFLDLVLSDDGQAALADAGFGGS